MARFVNIQIPLIDLDPDSEPDSPSSPPKSQSSSSTTPAVQPANASRLHPVVSDDVSSEDPSIDIEEHAPAPPPAPITGPGAPAPPRAPSVGPGTDVPAPPRSIPRPRHQARMSTGPQPRHPLAPRNPPTGRFPHSTYEEGESSHQAHIDRELGRLTVEMRDSRFSFSKLVGSHDRLMTHVGAMEESHAQWRQSVDERFDTFAHGLQGSREEYARRTRRMEGMVMMVVVMILLVLLVTLLPYFFPRG